MPTPVTYLSRDKTAYLFRMTRPDNGKRTKLRLGVVSKSFAREVGSHIDKMAEAIKYQTDYPPQTMAWLSTIPDDLYRRLAIVGLVGQRLNNSIPTLSEFLADYTKLKSLGGSRRGGWTTGTAKNRKQSVDDMVLYFGVDAALDQIDSGAPEEWLAWMIQPKPDGRGLAPATASKKLKDARQFFEFARRKRYVVINPFEGVRLPPQDNPERLVYVPIPSIAEVLKHVDDPEFRLVIALGRYAGLRIPSEASRLRWSDINWHKKTMRITAPKKAGNAVAGQRVCRLFDELMPFFEALGIPNSDTDSWVLPSIQPAARNNLRTKFGRYIDRAKIERWPRLFQNLRASALTDLAEIYPLPSVCKWLGNSVDVAMQHYLMLKGIDLTDEPLIFDSSSTPKNRTR